MKRAKVSWTKIVADTEKQLKLAKETKKRTTKIEDTEEQSSDNSREDINGLGTEVISDITPVKKNHKTKSRTSKDNKYQNRVTTQEEKPISLKESENEAIYSDSDYINYQGRRSKLEAIKPSSHKEYSSKEESISHEKILDNIDDQDVLSQIEARQKLKSSIFSVDKSLEGKEKKYVLTENGPILHQVFQHIKKSEIDIVLQDEAGDIQDTGKDINNKLSIEELFKNPRSSEVKEKLLESFSFGTELEDYRKDLDSRFEQVFKFNNQKNDISKIQVPLDPIDFNLKHNIKVFDDISQPPSGHQIIIKKEIANNKNYSNRPIDLKGVQKRVVPLLETIGGGIDQVRVRVSKFRSPQITSNIEETVSIPVNSIKENPNLNSKDEVLLGNQSEFYEIESLLDFDFEFDEDNHALADNLSNNLSVGLDKQEDNGYQTQEEFFKEEFNSAGIGLVADQKGHVTKFGEFDEEYYSDDEVLIDDINDDEALRVMAVKDKKDLENNKKKDFWGENLIKNKKGIIFKLKVFIFSLIITTGIIVLVYLAINNFPKYFNNTLDNPTSNINSNKNQIDLKFYPIASLTSKQEAQTEFTLGQPIMAKIIYQNADSGIIKVELINGEDNSAVFSNISFSVTGSGYKVINMPLSLNPGEYTLKVSGSLEAGNSFTIK